METDRLDFERALREKTEFAEAVLKARLPAEAGAQKRVTQAMNYSLTAGGKRLRPILMWETYRMCGGEESPVIECFMAAIEMIHTYSLVHDDLPAMDNDRYRRGKETTWYVYGDAMGILAGDGLLNYAFETACRALEYCLGGEEPGDCPDGRMLKSAEASRLEQARLVSRALSVLFGKSGIYGMIGGQAVDIEAEGENSGRENPGQENPEKENPKKENSVQKDSGEELERLLFIHEHKTAALIQAAMMVGAILAGASAEQVDRIEKCAYNIGVAFQIQDDILDVTGNSTELGKATGSDAQNNKRTYVTLKGLERSRADVETLSGEAVAILDEFEGEHSFLRRLIMALIHRRA